MNNNQNLNSLRERIKQFFAVSLRTKIILGNLLIVLITVTVMGIFVFYRSQATNEFLVNQFDVSVTREIEDGLTVVVSDEVNNISIFFSSMKNVIETFGTTTGAFLSNESTVNLESSGWNAYSELVQLPSGSWDNSNNDVASIFMPIGMRINDDLARELVAMKGLDYFIQGLIERNPEIIAFYFGGKAGETVYYPNIDLAAIVPPDFDITRRPWYVNAAGISQSKEKAVWSVPYQDAALNGLVITSSIPVYDTQGEFRGVAGIDLQLATITENVSSLIVGKTGYSFLIDSEGRLIAMPDQGLQDFNLTKEEIQSGDIENLSLTDRVSAEVVEILAKMTSGQSGVSLVEINGSNRYIAYRPIPVVGYSLGVVVSEEELLQDFVETNTMLQNENRQTIFNAVGIIFILLAVASLASYGIGSSITAPLGKLTSIAKEVASGNLEVRAEITTRDEIGLLGNTLNSMNIAAQNMVTNLEELVAERTHTVEKRVAQIQAVAEVGKAVLAQRDLEELLGRTTNLISNRFGYYHVGIFLLDRRGEYAILRATNSAEGEKLLAREHKLRVGVEGIVGTAAGSGEARIVLDVGQDAVYFNNPDLPQTRSEIALPLIASGEILGVLDVQSIEPNVFSEEDIPTLQILADQIATAVQNARMLHDTQEALFAARKATGEVSRRGWQTVLQNVETPGYISQVYGDVVPASDQMDPNTKQALNNGYYVVNEDQHTLSIPVITRGQTVGMLRLTKPPHDEPWTPDEIADVESLADQISNALDSARLYNDAQQRALRERTISEISTNIGASTNVDVILRTAVAELGRQISGAKVAVELNNEMEQEM